MVSSRLAPPRILAAGALLVLAACAAEAPSVVKTSSSPKAPPWLVKVPQEGDTLYFSGAREGATSLEEGTDAAMQVARAHAAEYIGVDVTSEHKDVMSTDLGSDRVQDTVKGRATALITNDRPGVWRCTAPSELTITPYTVAVIRMWLESTLARA